MNGPYNSMNLRAVFPCGTDKYGEQAQSSSELTVALSGQRVILTIEQTRHDICDPITGYGYGEVDLYFASPFKFN